MANLCSFSMILKGEEADIDKFKNMMKQTGNVWMGRGAEILNEETEETEDGKCRCQIDGYTKWSVHSSLIDNAISMRTEPDKWFFGDGEDKSKLTFVTMLEACEQLNLDMEVYSEEPGCGFQEHYVFIEGVLVADESVDYTEEYDEEADEWVSEGGFENWTFEI